MAPRACGGRSRRQGAREWGGFPGGKDVGVEVEGERTKAVLKWALRPLKIRRKNKLWRLGGAEGRRPFYCESETSPSPALAASLPGSADSAATTDRGRASHSGRHVPTRSNIFQHVPILGQGLGADRDPGRGMLTQLRQSLHSTWFADHSRLARPRSSVVELR